MLYNPLIPVRALEAYGMLDSRKLFRRLGVALNLRDPPNVPPYGWSYFDHLVAVYVTLNTADARADAVIKKSRERPDDLTWGDIFLLESVIFSLQPPDVVDRSAWILRERFREIAGSSVYDKYLASNVPKETDTPAKLSLVKADLTRILDVLHWYYSLIPIRERLRKSLTSACLVAVVFYTLALAGILVWCNFHNADFLAMLTCVVYCGIIGGFVSSQRRMQSIPADGDPLISVFGLDNAGYYLWLSPLLGAIFAALLTSMFVAGLLKGSVFPDFHLSSGGARQGLPFFVFTWNTVPKTSEEYAKLFVWAFLAGFAERLVPDSLDRLASKLGPGDQQSPPAVGPVVPAGKVSEPEDDSNVPEEMPRLAQKPAQRLTAETIQDVMHTGETPKPSKQDDSAQAK
jgi:hypothetical protein